MVIVSGPLEDLPGKSGNAYLTILINRLGLNGALAVWAFTILIAFFTLQTGMQANARAIFAFSRDHGLPDGKFFGKINKWSKTPINAVWCVVIISVALGCVSTSSTEKG